MGRRNKYESNIKPNMDMIVGYLNSGHTQASVAKRFGVGVSTWERYKSEYREFREAIKKAGMNATALVVHSLFKRANGYDYDETHVEERNVAGAVTTIAKKVTKQVPPDTAAGIFIVTNRDPENWKNTQNIKHSGEIKNAGVLMTAPPMSKEEWLEFYNKNVADKQNGQEKK